MAPEAPLEAIGTHLSMTVDVDNQRILNSDTGRYPLWPLRTVLPRRAVGQPAPSVRMTVGPNRSPGFPTSLIRTTTRSQIVDGPTDPAATACAVNLELTTRQVNATSRRILARATNPDGTAFQGTVALATATNVYNKKPDAKGWVYVNIPSRPGVEQWVGAEVTIQPYPSTLRCTGKAELTFTHDDIDPGAEPHRFNRPTVKQLSAPGGFNYFELTMNHGLTDLAGRPAKHRCDLDVDSDIRPQSPEQFIKGVCQFTFGGLPVNLPKHPFPVRVRVAHGRISYGPTIMIDPATMLEMSTQSAAAQLN